LKESQILSFLNDVETKIYGLNEVIYNVADSVENIYFIKKGQIEI